MKSLIIFILSLLIYWLLLPIGLIVLGKYLDTTLAFTSPDSPIFDIIGVILFLLGFYISLKSLLLFLIIGEGLPLFLTSPKRLVTEGLYSHSRNPLYIGFLLIMISLGIWFRSLAMLVLVLPIFAIFIIGYIIFFEEPISLRKYGERFNQYRKDVPLIWTFKTREPKGSTLFRLIFHLAVRWLSKKLFDIEIKGEENVPEFGAVLFVPNHISYLDPFLIGSQSFRTIRFLTTAQVYRKPIHRLFFFLMGSIPIKRFQRHPVGLRKMLRMLDKGYAIGYFPEGERTWTGLPTPYPDGVAKLLKWIKVTIIPVRIAGAYAVMPRWTNKWRRAKVSIEFCPPFVIEKSWSDEQLLSNLSEIIHTLNLKFKNEIHTRKKLNEGIHRLLWRCPICGDYNSLEEIGNTELLCVKCNTRWEFTNDNELKVIYPENFKKPKRKFWEWYELVLSFPFPNFHTKDNMDFLSHESLPCLVSAGKYPKLTFVDRGCFTLYRDGICFRGATKDLVWNFDDINYISAEGNNKMQIGDSRSQFQFQFNGESNIKWETLIDYVKSEQKRRQKTNTNI